MRRLLLVAVIIAVGLESVKSQAVELLLSPGFEPPVGAPPINSWDLSTFVTGNPYLDYDIAQLVSGSTDTVPNQLFLKAFAGNGALDPNDGNFLNDNLPGGDVAGLDFLAWQRGESPNAGDPNGLAADLVVWENNYGRVGGLLTNAIITQTVPVTGAAGQTYTFGGSARWEFNYAGGAGTLDASSPLGAVPSPTTNNMTLEFLNSGGSVIGSKSIDLADDGQFNLDLWQPHTVSEVAPVGTVAVRVTADARDMVYNVDPGQSAYYDSFTLTGSDDPGTELLENAGLDEPPFNALDFWDIFEIPTGCCSGEVLRTSTAFPFAARTGTTGVWLSAFFGAHMNFEDVPVTGLMSQTVDAVPGGVYNFSGWAKFETNYSGGVDTINAASTGFFAGQPSPTETIIALEFLDIGGNVLNPIIDFDPNGVTILDPNSPNLIDLRAERQALCGGNANNQNCVFPGQVKPGWTQHTLTGIIAPPNTAFARLTGGMTNGVFNTDAGGGQSAFFDDFSLDGPAALQAATVGVPEPATTVGFMVGALMAGLGRSRRRTA